MSSEHATASAIIRSAHLWRSRPSSGTLTHREERADGREMIEAGAALTWAPRPRDRRRGYGDPAQGSTATRLLGLPCRPSKGARNNKYGSQCGCAIPTVAHVNRDDLPEHRVDRRNRLIDDEKTRKAFEYTQETLQRLQVSESALRVHRLNQRRGRGRRKHTQPLESLD